MANHCCNASGPVFGLTRSARIQNTLTPASPRLSSGRSRRSPLASETVLPSASGGCSRTLCGARLSRPSPRPARPARRTLSPSTVVRQMMRGVPRIIVDARKPFAPLLALPSAHDAIEHLLDPGPGNWLPCRQARLLTPFRSEYAVSCQTVGASFKPACTSVVGRKPKSHV